MALPAGVPAARRHMALRRGSRASGRGYHATPETGMGSLSAPCANARIPGADGATMRREVVVTGAGRETLARVDVPFAPVEVRVDPDGKLLLKVIAIDRR